ncbi:MAG: mercury(II) reductase [Methylohalobius sp.]|nr:mercury(II) reductase [Methylohalobius sp.]
MGILGRVGGTTCDHGARQVEQALQELTSMAAQVSYPEGLARVEAASSLPVSRLPEAEAAKDFSAEPLAQTPKARPGNGCGLNIAVLGSGAAAFACALRAAEEGARVTLIEPGTLGGTCVNTGCVPSKILIQAAQIAHLKAYHPFAGLDHAPPQVDWNALLAQLQARVEELRSAKYQRLLETNPNLHLLRGTARFEDAHTLKVTGQDGEKCLQPDRILIATGAVPALPQVPGLKETPYWTSTQALAAETLPEHLIVYGGSAVALELAQAFRRLGSRVTLIARSTLLSRLFPELGAYLKEILAQEGMQIMLHTQLVDVRYRGERFEVTTSHNQVIVGDKLLIAVGRRPNTFGLELSRAGVATDKNGAILVDAFLRTSAEHIYAAGDCTGLPQHVYVAAAAGHCAAVNMTGGHAKLDLTVLPVVFFTDPQVASVGLTEQEAARLGLRAESRTLSLDEVPRALVNFDTRGFIHLVAERESGRLLGAHVLATNAGEVIQAAALAIRAQMTVDKLAGQFFPYLTMVEGLKLCAQAFRKDVRRLSCCAA